MTTTQQIQSGEIQTTLQLTEVALEQEGKVHLHPRPIQPKTLPKLLRVRLRIPLLCEFDLLYREG